MSKPDSKLVESPVETLCGDPMNRKYEGTDTAEVYGMKGPEGVSEGLGADFALIYEDITPSAKQDKPSDAGTFAGNKED